MWGKEELAQVALPQSGLEHLQRRMKDGQEADVDKVAQAYSAEGGLCFPS